MDRAGTLAALHRGDLAGAREIRLPDGLDAFPSDLHGLTDSLELLDLGRGTYALPDDLGRFRRLRVLFCSGTPFPRLPPVLGECPALGQVGFRGCGIAEVPPDSLPPSLRWLTLTDNRIATLPEALGQRPLLQKLMLSGNRLAALPESLAGADSLELLRAADNRLERLPPWLAHLPRLAWISYASNPAEPAAAPMSAPVVPWSEVGVGELLGEGSSGRVHRATWPGPGDVALKLFKGAVGSDGLPDREIAASLTAGRHPAVIGALGAIGGHPDGTPGLLLPLVPADWPVLAGPPSLASCSRDVYDPALRVGPQTVRTLAGCIAGALAHLHGRGLMHGDVYGHNILWDGARGAATLGDFGAASTLPAGAAGGAFARIETLAFGILLGELLDRCEAPPPELRDLKQACSASHPSARPRMREVAEVLAA